MIQGDSSTKRLLMGLAVGVVLGLGVGLMLWLFFAWQVNPVEWTDAGPQDLRVDYAAYYWELVAESYEKHGDLELAQKQLGLDIAPWEEKKMEAALERAYVESSPEVKMYLDSLKSKIGVTTTPSETPVAQETPAPQETPTGETGKSPLAGLLPGLLVLLLVALLLGIGAMFVMRMRKRGQAAPAPAAEEEPPEWLSTLHPEETGPALPSLGHFVTSYALGNDTYDESFSVETSAGEFLGECGVGISETIGVGDPDKVTAFEVWLFDKNDIRTVTQVLMSEHAFNDPELRASLAPKGEAILGEVNVPRVLETATLRLDVLITELTYGTGSLPPNSFYDRLTIELVARGKEAGLSEESIV